MGVASREVVLTDIESDPVPEPLALDILPPSENTCSTCEGERVEKNCELETPTKIASCHYRALKKAAFSRVT